MPDRREELAESLGELRDRIAAACAQSGRAPGEITLIAVTKTFPASDVRLLAELGVGEVGENRDDEAVAKHAACADLDLRWHFVGQLQRRKCRSVAGYASVVHSVDRPELATALGSAARDAGRLVEALVQVSLDPPGTTDTSGRGGAPIEAVRDLATLVAETEGLALRGVMAVAPLGADPGPAYARLAEVSAQVRVAFPAATVISAGMSGDLEAAIANGATHLRVGTALLGGRTAPLG